MVCAGEVLQIFQFLLQAVTVSVPDVLLASYGVVLKELPVRRHTGNFLSKGVLRLFTGLRLAEMNISHGAPDSVPECTD
jgi:hypothetical protein